MGTIIVGLTCKACGRTAPIETANFEKGDIRCNNCISKGRPYKFWTPNVAAFVLSAVLIILAAIFQ